MRRPFGLIVPVVITCGGLPVAALVLVGEHHVMPPMWVHFYGVGVSALAASVLAAAVTWYGARQRDVRTVVVGGGFSLMAALLAVHGLSTPGMVIGPNGLIAVTGADAARRRLRDGALRAAAVRLGARDPRVLAVQLSLAAAVTAFSILGALDPKLVPGVPAPKSAPAIALFALGLVVYGALAVRATNTFLLTRRAADFAVVLGVVLLSRASFYGADPLLHGSRLVARPHVRDGRPRRRRQLASSSICAAAAAVARRSSATCGAGGARRVGGGVPRRTRPRAHRASRGQGRIDRRAHETRRHAPRCRSARCSASPPRACAASRSAVSYTTSASSRSPKRSSGSPARSTSEYDVVKQPPRTWTRAPEARARRPRRRGRPARARPSRAARRERLPHARSPGDELDLSTRILAVCDVYDALVSRRAYRPAWSREQALGLLHDESGVGFDSRCVAALERIVGVERDALEHVELRAASPAPSGP